MANETETIVVLGEYLDQRIREALDVLVKRNPDLQWTRDQLIRLAIGHGLDLLIRRHARKKTNLTGVLYTLSPGISGEEISIEDISQGGIGFRVAEEPDIKVSQVFQVEFILDNKNQTTISKTLIITHVSGRRIGAEFCDPLDSYDRELMGYLSQD